MGGSGLLSLLYSSNFHLSQIPSTNNIFPGNKNSFSEKNINFSGLKSPKASKQERNLFATIKEHQIRRRYHWHWRHKTF